jgi:hypothetical protein
MKRFATCLLGFFLLSAALVPAPVVAPVHAKSGNSCGMTVCCCPHRCAMMQKKLACRIQDSRRCGLRSSMPEASLVQFAASVFRVGLAIHSLAGSNPKGALLISETFPRIAFNSRSPLDKPPALLS